MNMKRRPNRNTVDREQAIRYGILPEEQVAHWTEIEEGRYQPRRKSALAWAMPRL